MFKLVKYMKSYILQCFAIVVAVGLQVYGTLMLPTEMSKIVNDGIVKNNIDFIANVLWVDSWPFCETPLVV